MNHFSQPGTVPPVLPIFSQDWWTRIACGADYQESSVLHGNTVVGRLPFVVSRNRIGLARVRDPYWSHLGGPVVDECLSRRQQAEVLDQLLCPAPKKKPSRVDADQVAARIARGTAGR